MTIDRAIEILNPEHRENYDGMDEVNEACRMGMEALERTRWIPCSERPPEEKGCYLVAVKHWFDGMGLTGFPVRKGWRLRPELPIGSHFPSHRRRKTMKRLTVEHWQNLDPWECCGQDNYCMRPSNKPGG